MIWLLLLVAVIGVQATRILRPTAASRRMLDTMRLQVDQLENERWELLHALDRQDEADRFMQELQRSRPSGHRTGPWPDDRSAPGPA